VCMCGVYSRYVFCVYVQGTMEKRCALYGVKRKCTDTDLNYQKKNLPFGKKCTLKLAVLTFSHLRALIKV